MNPAATPSLASLWLHWVVANATGAGLLWTCLVGIDLGYGSEFIVGFVTLISGLVVIGYAQQLVLKPWIRYVKYWALALPALCLLGCQLAAIPSLLTSLLIASPVEWLAGKDQLVFQVWIHLLCGTTYFGAGFSLVQTPYLSVTWKNTLLWMVASGLGFAGGVLGFGMCYYNVEYSLPMKIGVASLSGAVGGAVYGIITGAALVLMLRGHASYPVKMRY